MYLESIIYNHYYKILRQHRVYSIHTLRSKVGTKFLSLYKYCNHRDQEAEDPCTRTIFVRGPGVVDRLPVSQEKENRFPFGR